MFSLGQVVFVKRSSGNWTQATVCEVYTQHREVKVGWTEGGKKVGKFARFEDILTAPPPAVQ